jgi:hypothetical protein
MEKLIVLFTIQYTSGYLPIGFGTQSCPRWKPRMPSKARVQRVFLWRSARRLPSQVDY